MRRLLFVTICGLVFVSLSCKRGGEVVDCRYYDTKELYLEVYNDYDAQLKQIRRFYKNGNLMDIHYVKLNGEDSSSCIGAKREYYADGFPKGCEPLSDSGYSILPKLEDAKKGYAEKFSFGIDTSITMNGSRYLFFRIYLEGVSPIHYDIAIIDTLGSLISPWKAPKKDSVYDIYNEDNILLYKTTIDERLYPYMLLCDSRFLHKGDDGCWYLKLAIYFPSLVSDTTMPNPHQKSIHGVRIKDMDGKYLNLP